MYQTKIITDLNQLNDDLKSEWNLLLQQSSANSIFLTWEWITSWFQVFGDNTVLFIITVRDTKEHLVGIAPLHIRKSIYYKFPTKEMTFIGIGHSDIQDFIIANDEQLIINEIITIIKKNKSLWDIVQLEQINEGSFLLKSKYDNDFKPQIELCSVSTYVTIEDSWETYYKSFSKKFKKDLRNKLNKINRIGEWHFSTERTIDNVDTILEIMDQNEKKSKKATTKKAFITNTKNKDFLKLFLILSLKESWLDFSTLTLNKKYIAHLLGFIRNNKYYAYNISHIEKFFDLSPGKLLINEKMQWCFEHKDEVQEFNFLRGDTYIKTLWKSKHRNHSRMVFFNNTFYSQTLKFIAFHLRPRIKNLIRYFK